MDEEAKKNNLKSIPYGLYVVGTRRGEGAGEELNAMVGSWVMQCSFKPPMIAVGVKRESLSFGFIRETGAFTLNFLDKDQKALAAKFFKDVAVEDSRMNGVSFERGKNGCPVFPDLPGHLECEVVEVVAGENDHAVFVARVTDAVRRRDFEPLTYANTGWSYGG